MTAFEKVGPSGPVEREWFDASGNFHRLYANGAESMITAELIADDLYFPVDMETCGCPTGKYNRSQCFAERHRLKLQHDGMDQDCKCSCHNNDLT